MDETPTRGTWVSLSQALAQRLQQHVRDGTWAAGARIPSQRMLSQQYGVSRASLREALMTLETLGLLRSEPGRGTFVAGLGAARAQPAPWRHAGTASQSSVFAARVMLEPAIAAACAFEAGGAQDELFALTDAMEAAWRSGDLIAHVDADHAFHGRLADRCANPVLQGIYHGLRDILRETQRLPISVTPDSRMTQSLDEHRRIARAVRAGDGAAAYDAMSDHIVHTARCAGITLHPTPRAGGTGSADRTAES